MKNGWATADIVKTCCYDCADLVQTHDAQLDCTIKIDRIPPLRLRFSELKAANLINGNLSVSRPQLKGKLCVAALYAIGGFCFARICL